ncbi:MAG TPA: ATP synthase F1 subunit gamma [Thermoanaerobaculia bacterium]|jgi:F-type H+-transporting ATPase subunit gamma|nr:ATP synthase F1 subunit gamma [Thermoanaerobaculia bacterium]
MANLIDIRRRIRSVKNTQQITKAMKMVAAARLRRAQDRILATRPYALEIKKVIANLAAHAAGRLKHPLLEVRPEERVLLIVVTGDKGLAGSFNANVLRRAVESIPRLKSVELLLLGSKGVAFFRRRPLKVRKGYTTLFSNVTYAQAEEIAADLREAYATGAYDAVHVIYNKFKSIISQELTEERLLPIPAGEGAAAETAAGGQTREYLFEPSAEEILEELLPRYVTFQVYRILLESQAAEHAARMTASDSATKNAGEIIDRLTLRYNRARQAAITTELIEVVSGANALEG